MLGLEIVSELTSCKFHALAWTSLLLL